MRILILARISIFLVQRAKSYYFGLVQVQKSQLFHKLCGKLVRMIPSKRAIFHSITFFALITIECFTSSAQNVSLQEPIEGWNEIIEDKSIIEEYVIQKGDNLYDVSKIFFGDAHYWPKIWSLNPSITNPHVISPGQVVFFKSGSVVNPPSVGILSEVGISRVKQIATKSLDKPVIPEAKPKKLIKKLPDSLPQIYINLGADDVDENVIANLQSGRRAVESQFNSVDLTSEALSKKPQSYGELVAVEDGGTFARYGDKALLKFNSPVNMGDVFSFYKLLDKKRVTKGNDPVHIIEWQGEVKVLKIVDDSKNTYIGEISKAFAAIPVGAGMTTQLVRSFKYGEERAASISTIDKKLKLLGAQGSLGRNLIGEGEIVYLNKGSIAGVKPGQVYSLDTSISDFFDASEVKGVPGQVALFKIVSVDENYSTGVTYNLKNVVSSGAETRTNTSL